jgi:hypothetical protein
MPLIPILLTPTLPARASFIRPPISPTLVGLLLWVCVYLGYIPVLVALSARRPISATLLPARCVSVCACVCVCLRA